MHACNSCHRLIHKSCVAMLTAEYDQLANTFLPWFCLDCGTAHHSSVIYDIPVSDISGYHSSVISDGMLSSPKPSASIQVYPVCLILVLSPLVVLDVHLLRNPQLSPPQRASRKRHCAYWFSTSRVSERRVNID